MRWDKKTEHEIYILNFNQNFSIETSKKTQDISNLTNEENYFDYCKNTGMSSETQLLLANYSAMIHKGLQGKETFTSSDIEKVISNLKYLYSRSGKET